MWQDRVKGVATRIENSAATRVVMRKSLSRNPNMMRTMIGIGLVLILVLSYAVYSNTLDSEYYGYTTTNEEVELDMQETEEGSAEWYSTTISAITWINVSVSGAPEGSSIQVEAFGTEWYYSPLLGFPGAENFYCRHSLSADSGQVSESCELAVLHEKISEGGEDRMLGLVLNELPIGGLGYLHSDDSTSAEVQARELIERSEVIVTWRVKVLEDGEPVASEGVELSVSVVTHELVSVHEFKLDPVQESVYSLATLVGCFSLLLIIPLTVYFSVVYKTKKDERVRLETPEVKG